MPSAQGLELEFNLTRDPLVAARRPQALRMLVLGDFSAREGRAQGGPAREHDGYAVTPVDVDSFESLLWRLAPRLEIALPVAGATVGVVFRSLEDFRPDALFERLPLFAPWRELRARLLDPAAFPSAVEELVARLGGSPAPESGEEPPQAERGGAEPTENDREVIERLLGRTPARGVAGRGERSGQAQTLVSELIRQAVGPHAAPEEAPHRDLYLGALDTLVGERMRALLHDPGLQALEARWRALHHLVTNLETDEALQIHLLDCSPQGLASALRGPGQDLRASALYRLLVETTGLGTPGGEPWSLLVGCFAFGPSAPDLALLGALGAIGAAAGGPFVAAASPELVGCESIAATPDPSAWGPLPAEAEAAWTALRRSPVARWIGLALPRFLLRLPYGEGGEPIDAFPFEELGTGRRHEDYLWGNPAFLCARLIGQAYTENGWSLEPGDVLEVGELPAHVYAEDGEKRLQACAELYLTERAAEALLDRGLMPLLSLKGRDQVRLARFQSIASPPAALAGPWGG